MAPVGGTILVITGFYVMWGGLTGRLAPMIAAIVKPSALVGPSTATSSGPTKQNPSALPPDPVAPGKRVFPIHSQ